MTMNLKNYYFSGRRDSTFCGIGSTGGAMAYVLLAHLWQRRSQVRREDLLIEEKIGGVEKIGAKGGVDMY